LKAKGHEVELFIYHPHLSFHRPSLDEAEIPIHEVHGVSGFSFRVVKFISMLIREKRFHAVISFLPSPNIYSILAKLVSKSNTCLVLGERASKASDTNLWLTLTQRFLYIIANKVVANSFHQALHLRNYFWLSNKVSTIYNGYSVKSNSDTYTCRDGHTCRLLVVGRVHPGKNGVALLKALILYYQKNSYIPELSWAGRREQDQKSVATLAEMDRLIADHPAFQAQWKWLGHRMDIPQLLADSDALIHVSLYEGLPNVICEAFIAGRPVIASSVCDHSLLVEEGIRGLLCDPLSPESICAAIERFVALSPEARQAMGYNARRYAEEHLTVERMVTEYEALLT
jgi:glycosyltransferase involved in cell wall biosynthesis